MNATKLIGCIGCLAINWGRCGWLWYDWLWCGFEKPVIKNYVRISPSFTVLGLWLAFLSNPVLAETGNVDKTPSIKSVIAYGLEIQEKQDGSDITVKLDGKPEHSLFFMDSPPRLVIELTNASVKLDMDAETAKSKHIKSVRYGAMSKTKSRIVLNLDGPSTLSESALNKVENSHRYVLSLSLSPISEEQFLKAISLQQDLLGKSGGSVTKGDRVRSAPKKSGHFVIVIDPGHGGIDGGAIGVKSKILEKDITLAIAKTLGKKLETAGPFDVKFTRTEDVFVSLKSRLEFTQRNKADLMISLHADSLRQHFVRGATVYTLAKKASDALSKEIADSENLTDIVAGLAVPDNKDEVFDILADLTLRETKRFSKAFSKDLISHLQTKIKMIKNPQRSASFAVLKNAEIPSVLIEMGYLSNKSDEIMLSNRDWQGQVAEAIKDSVIGFFSSRTKQVKAN